MKRENPRREIKERLFCLCSRGKEKTSFMVCCCYSGLFVFKQYSSIKETIPEVREPRLKGRVCQLNVNTSHVPFIES